MCLESLQKQSRECGADASTNAAKCTTGKPFLTLRRLPMTNLNARCQCRVATILLSICTTIVSLCTAKPSFAGVNATMCEAYASSADHATGLMKEIGGVASPSNPRYRTDAQGNSYHVSHTGWCSGARIESVADEEVGRLQDLYSKAEAKRIAMQGSRTPLPPDFARRTMCSQYVFDVAEGNSSNAGHGASCGYQGNRWGTNLSAHAAWCMSAKLEDIYNEERGRIDDIDHCDMCQEYAAAAKRDRDLAVTRRCSLSGPRWSTDPNVHVGWCMNALKSSVWKEQGDRTLEAGTCH
jgi:hypothetical protein